MLSSIWFAQSTGDESRYGGSYGANWASSDSATDDSSIADNVLSSEHYEQTASSQTNEEDVESLIVLIVEKQKEKVHVTIKDLIKTRNMYEQNIVNDNESEPALPQSGADPSLLYTMLPNMLPKTGVAQHNNRYLYIVLFGIFGLLVTLSWKEQS